MVLYDGANNFYGRYSNIETGGRGDYTCEFLRMLKKYLIDLSVPNFNVTDCSMIINLQMHILTIKAGNNFCQNEERDLLSLIS